MSEIEKRRGFPGMVGSVTASFNEKERRDEVWLVVVSSSEASAAAAGAAAALPSGSEDSGSSISRIFPVELL